VIDEARVAKPRVNGERVGERPESLFGGGLAKCTAFFGELAGEGEPKGFDLFLRSAKRGECSDSQSLLSGSPRTSLNSSSERRERVGAAVEVVQ